MFIKINVWWITSFCITCRSHLQVWGWITESESIQTTSGWHPASVKQHPTAVITWHLRYTGNSYCWYQCSLHCSLVSQTAVCTKHWPVLRSLCSPPGDSMWRRASAASNVLSKHTMSWPDISTVKRCRETTVSTHTSANSTCSPRRG